MFGELLLFNEDLRYLMRKLLLGYHVYFSKSGVLNSDGRRIFEEIIRTLLREHPEFKPLVKKTRRNPTLENVLKIARIFMDPKEISEIVALGIYGPYKYF